MEFKFKYLGNNAEGPVYVFENKAGQIVEIGYNWQNPNEFVIVAFTVGLKLTKEERQELYAKCLKIEEM